MELGAKINHVIAIALHNCGKSYSQIFELLKPLKISRMFICQAIKHYEELCKVEDMAHSGRLKSLRAQAAINTVHSGRLKSLRAQAAINTVHSGRLKSLRAQAAINTAR
jgi:hypothetical protein